MKKLLFFCLLICSNFFSQTLTLDWVKELSYNDNVASIIDLKKDSNGDFILFGKFHDTLDIDPSSSVFNLISNGLEECHFFAKFDQFGNFVWAKQIGRAANDNLEIYDFSLDNNDNIYFTGILWGLVDFDPDVTIQNLSPQSYGDLYICRENLATFRVSKQSWSVSIGKSQDSDFSRLVLKVANEQSIPLSQLAVWMVKIKAKMNRLMRHLFYLIVLR